MVLGTRNSRSHLILIGDIARKIGKSNVRNGHETRTGKRAVIALILIDHRTCIGTLNLKVRENDITDIAPAAAAGETGTLIGVLRGGRANPCLDVSAAVHVFVVSDELCTSVTIAMGHVDEGGRHVP